MTPFCAIDFETANTDPRSACAIGIAKVDDVGQITHSEVWLIRPPTRDFTFTWVHGLTWESVQSASPFAEVWPLVVPHLTGVEHLVAHNVPFDSKVLAACLGAAGLEMPPHPWLCTLKMARQKWGNKGGVSNKLPDVCKRLGIGFSDHHEAESDAVGCARILVAIRNEEARQAAIASGAMKLPEPKKEPIRPTIPVAEPPAIRIGPKIPCAVCGLFLDSFGICTCQRVRVKECSAYEKLPGEAWESLAAMNLLCDAIVLGPLHAADAAKCVWAWFIDKRPEMGFVQEVEPSEPGESNPGEAEKPGEAA